jgi:hypothetical protein
MKFQTLIFNDKHELVLRIDDLLYHPVDVIEINGREWQEWDILDEFGDWIVRKIYLKA